VALSVNLVVIWCFLLGACELIHVFVRKERNYNDHAQKIRRNRKNSVAWAARRSRFVALRFRPSDLFRQHYLYNDDKLVAESLI